MTGGGAWPRRGGAVLGAGSQLALSVRGWGLSPGGVASYGGGFASCLWGWCLLGGVASSQVGVAQWVELA